MSFQIVTGYTGVAHVTPQQDRFINQGAFGSGTVVLPVGNQLACTVSAAMKISVADGTVSMQGCIGVLEPSSVAQFTLEEGTTGLKRIDYLCAQYNKTGGGVESMSLVVKTGTPTSGTPSAPTYASGTIAGLPNTTVEAPLWKINIDGLSITSVERIAPVIQAIPSLMSSLSGFTSLLSGKATAYTFTSGADVNTARSNMSTGDVFAFFGKDTFSQDVLGLSTQANAFGIGFKNAYSSVALLTICGGNLYYSTYNSSGTGNVYNPLNLMTNI